jgi:hypothetical protein
MRYLKAFVATACLAGVSACGGGGGGVSSTPTPTPGPTPTNATLVNLQYSQEFVADGHIIPFSVAKTTGAAQQRPSVPGAGGPAKVAYNAGTNSYTVTFKTFNGTSSASFGPADRQASSNGTITNYQRVSGTRQENLSLFVPGPTNTELVLTYASYGAYQSITDAGANLDVDTVFFTYGIPTASTDLPRSGTATYATRIDGQLADNSGVYALAGSSSFQADFGASTMAFSMSPIGTNVLTGGTRSFGTQTVDGTISNTAGAQPQFTGNGGGSGYGVALSGHFYGPAAAEIGGAFSISGPNGANGVGAVVGRKN